MLETTDIDNYIRVECTYSRYYTYYCNFTLLESQTLTYFGGGGGHMIGYMTRLGNRLELLKLQHHDPLNTTITTHPIQQHTVRPCDLRSVKYWE
jgi:hypothetical protein